MNQQQEREDINQPGWAVLDLSKLRALPGVIFGFLYFVATLMGIYLLATAALLIFRTFHPVWTFEELRSDELKNLLIAIGAVIAAPFAIWRIIISHQMARAANDQATVARENHYTSLFTKAIEQLGATREVKKTLRNGSAEGWQRFGDNNRYNSQHRNTAGCDLCFGAYRTRLRT